MPSKLKEPEEHRASKEGGASSTERGKKKKKTEIGRKETTRAHNEGEENRAQPSP